MTTPDTLTTERILNAAHAMGCNLHGWERQPDGSWMHVVRFPNGKVAVHKKLVFATPADRKAIICEIVERLYELGWRLEWTDTLYAGRPTWQWLPGMVGVVRDAAFDTAAVNAALKVGGEG